MRGDKFGQPRVHPLRLVDRQKLAGDQLGTRRIDTVTPDESRNRRIPPADLARFIQLEGSRCRGHEGAHPGLDLVGKAAARGGKDRRLLVTLTKGGAKHETVQDADFLTFDQNGTVTFYRGHEIPCFLQLSAQMRSTPVDEPL